MDSRLPALDVRPWRTATLVASAIAAVELVLLVVAALVLLARPLSHRVTSAATAHVAAKPKPAPAAPTRRARPKFRPAPVRLHLSRAHTRILVLNGNGETGAAGRQAAEVQRFGYPVERVADAARMDYPASVVMYRPGFAAEGKRLAHDLRISVVGPLDGLSIRELGHAQVALVVGH